MSQDSLFIQIWQNQLCDFVVPHIMRAFIKLFQDSRAINRVIPLKVFQQNLKFLKNLSQSRLEDDYHVLLKNGCKPEWLEKIIRVIFTTSARMDLVKQGAPKNIKIRERDLMIPDNVTFLHKCYVEAAREIWKNPQLFHDKYSKIEIQNNYNRAQEMIKSAVITTIRRLIPYEQLHHRYLNRHSEDSEEKQRELNKLLEKDRSLLGLEDLPDSEEEAKPEPIDKKLVDSRVDNRVDSRVDNRVDSRRVEVDEKSEISIVRSSPTPKKPVRPPAKSKKIETVTIQQNTVGLGSKNAALVINMLDNSGRQVVDGQSTVKNIVPEITEKLSMISAKSIVSNKPVSVKQDKPFVKPIESFVSKLALEDLFLTSSDDGDVTESNYEMRAPLRYQLDYDRSDLDPDRRVDRNKNAHESEIFVTQSCQPRISVAKVPKAEIKPLVTKRVTIYHRHSADESRQSTRKSSRRSSLVGSVNVSRRGSLKGSRRSSLGSIDFKTSRRSSSESSSSDHKKSKKKDQESKRSVISSKKSQIAPPLLPPSPENSEVVRISVDDDFASLRKRLRKDSRHVSKKEESEESSQEESNREESSQEESSQEKSSSRQQNRQQSSQSDQSGESFSSEQPESSSESSSSQSSDASTQHLGKHKNSSRMDELSRLSHRPRVSRSLMVQKLRNLGSVNMRTLN